MVDIGESNPVAINQYDRRKFMQAIETADEGIQAWLARNKQQGWGRGKRASFNESVAIHKKYGFGHSHFKSMVTLHAEQKRGN